MASPNATGHPETFDPESTYKVVNTRHPDTTTVPSAYTGILSNESITNPHMSTGSSSDAITTVQVQQELKTYVILQPATSDSARATGFGAANNYPFGPQVPSAQFVLNGVSVPEDLSIVSGNMTIQPSITPADREDNG